MLQALINLFKSRSEEKTKVEPPVLTEVIKEPAVVKEPINEIKIDVPMEIKLPVEPTVIAEPVSVNDVLVVEVEKKPKRGRPKTGSKPKTSKKK